jgi:cardiolipin synthase
MRREGYRLHGEALDVGDRAFLRACEALTAAPISDGNSADLLINGDRIFPRFLEVISGAQRTVNLLTYVYWKGEMATAIAEALCERASAGVECNVLLDAIGTIPMDRELPRRMEQAGVRIARFRPARPGQLRKANNRTHRKLLIADGTVGMTGGVGIAEEWEGDAQDPDHWRDTHVAVRGPVVRGIQGAFAENWLEATGEVLVGPGYLPDLEPVEDGGPMQLVRSVAETGDSNVEALYFLALACARETLDLTAAYFAPNPEFVQALCDAADRGVRVRVLVPGPHIDKEFVRVAGRDCYEALLGCGVQIFEYGPTMLHAKTLCVDGVWSSVGSVNFDNRSFALHDEATLCVQSPEFARLLGEQFERDLEVSERIVPDRFAQRPVTHRLRERAMALVRRQI